MSEFRLTQISDTHLARSRPTLTDNFHRVSEHIDATRPDLVVNSGDLAFDAPTGRDDLDFARELHAALPVACRCLPGNHDIGDNPTEIGAPPPQPARRHLIGMLARSELRLVASGHVHQLRDFTFCRARHIWAPSTGFVISDARQERIGVKQVGLVEYRFRQDSVEIRHVRAAGQVDVDLDSLLAEVG